LNNMFYFYRCDSTALDGKPVTGPQGSYTHAQKMRASMTHVFSRVLGLGSQRWQYNVAQDGKVTTSGNSSVSDRVSTYMVGLWRCQVGLMICFSACLLTC
jgi:hypothetical protein